MLLAGSRGKRNAMGWIYRHIVRTILGAAAAIPVRFIGITTSVIYGFAFVIAPTGALIRRRVGRGCDRLSYREAG